MPHPSDHLKLLIQTNAQEVVRLHDRIKKTFKLRDTNAEKWREWQRACEVFHFDGALERLMAGDPETMEATICFLELRPYFFRSGYMFESLFRKAKHAPLNPEQNARLQHVALALATWKANKTAKPGNEKAPGK